MPAAAEAHPAERGDSDPSGSWRRTVEAFWLCAATDEELEDLAELRDLMSSNFDMQTRLQVQRHGDCPILVTAPHCISLLRDGWVPHVVEGFTFEIASAVARELRGRCLSWSRAEQRRTELLWALEKQRGIGEGTLLDPQNRDPNYLSTAELAANPWFQQMLRTTMGWRARFGHGAAILHLDIHGCRGPPGTPAHLTIGLGAMMLQAIHTGGHEAASRVIAFGAALEVELTAVLAQMAKLDQKAKLVSVVVPDENGNASARFTGAWRLGTRRHTQSQQSVNFACVTHAVQLEMSKVLRQALLQDQAAIPQFGGAVMAAWQSARKAGKYK